MSLFGLSEKRRIRELEKQVSDQQQIIDNLLKLTERSLNAYADAHSIVTEAITIAKKVVNDPDSIDGLFDYKEKYAEKYKCYDDDDIDSLVMPADDDDQVIKKQAHKCLSKLIVLLFRKMMNGVTGFSFNFRTGSAFIGFGSIRMSYNRCSFCSDFYNTSIR